MDNTQQNLGETLLFCSFLLAIKYTKYSPLWLVDDDVLKEDSNKSTELCIILNTGSIQKAANLAGGMQHRARLNI